MIKSESNSKKFNRGTLRAGYNKIIKCRCCGFGTQSQIGSGTDLCQECYDFSGEYNSWQDGETKAVDLPVVHRCPTCKQEREEAIQADNAKAAPVVSDAAQFLTGSQLASIYGEDAIKVTPTRRQKGVINYRGSEIRIKDMTGVGLGFQYSIISGAHLFPSRDIAADTRNQAITNAKHYVTAMLNGKSNGSDHHALHTDLVRCPNHASGGATFCPRGGAELQMFQARQWGR